ncbi:MAG: hypothetical protein WDN69_10920 [Aliidongia sp.]
MVQGFYTDHFMARSGQEILGYSQLPTSAPWPTALQGATIPDIINTAYFQNERLRRGGDFAVEWKPTSQLDVKLNGFYSYENDTNYNQGDLANIGGGGGLVVNKIVPSSYSVSERLVNSATFAPGLLPNGETMASPASTDIYRPDAIASSYFLNLDGTYKPYANVILHGNVGYTQGKSGTNQLALGTTGNAESGVAYALNGGNPAAISYPGAGAALNNPANYTAFGGNGNQDWVGFDQFAYIDSEGYGQLDARISARRTASSQSVKAGVRVTEHNRNSTESEDFAGCYSAACNLSLGGIANGLFPTGGFQAAGIPGALHRVGQSERAGKPVDERPSTTMAVPARRSAASTPRAPTASRRTRTPVTSWPSWAGRTGRATSVSGLPRPIEAYRAMRRPRRIRRSRRSPRPPSALTT